MAITGKLRWDEETLELENQGARTELRYILESDDPENEDREQAMAWLLDDTEPHNVPRTLYGLRWNRLSVKEIIRVENEVLGSQQRWPYNATLVLSQMRARTGRQ